MKTKKANQFAICWLATIAGAVLLMVVVEEITRLTESGLSIVEWQPIVGPIPPLSMAAWSDLFRRYQSSPEFKLINHTMTLGQFKTIFFWEYLHRLLARLIGVIFFFPLVLMWYRKEL